MCADGGAVDHLQCRRVRVGVGECRQHDVPDARQCPSSELLIDRVPGAELGRQIAPWRTRAGDPENAVQRAPVIPRRPPAERTIVGHERCEHRPLLIAHRPANQARLPPKAALNHAPISLGIGLSTGPRAESP